MPVAESRHDCDELVGRPSENGNASRISRCNDIIKKMRVAAQVTYDAQDLSVRMTGRRHLQIGVLIYRV